MTLHMSAMKRVRPFYIRLGHMVQHVFQRIIYASIRKNPFRIPETEPELKSEPEPEPEPAMDHHTYDIHEIYHIVFLLQQKLVRDVIPAIIEYAELYECTTSETRFYPLLQIAQHQAPKQLLACEIPRSVARVLRPVRKIVFSINSHDQGFASDPDAGNWTWFTAQKLSATTETRQSDADGPAPAVNEHRELFRNPMASIRWFTHELVWRADSKDEAETEWVSSLQAGDRFSVHAWARYPGWVNHVSDISVKVYTVAVA